MNKQLLDAYDQINPAISDLTMYARDKKESLPKGVIINDLANEATRLAMSLQVRIERLMKLEGMKIPGE